MKKQLTADKKEYSYMPSVRNTVPPFLKTSQTSTAYKKPRRRLMSIDREHIVLVCVDEGHVHLALHLAELTAKQISASEMNKMIFEKLLEPAISKRVTLIVFVSKRTSSLCFLVQYQKLKAVVERDLYPSAA